MHQFQKHFTLAEARALLPRLRELLREGQRWRELFAKADQRLSELRKEGGADLGGSPVNALLQALLQMRRQLRGIEELGVQLKDFERGLVDFPHLRDDREVFLCWELDEDDIEFWHDLDSGYAGRERL